jgi:hypothetical protein
MENRNGTPNRETNIRRKYTRRYENTGTGAYFTKNQFSLLESVPDDVAVTPKPSVSGKKKAVSPLDSDVALKKIRDTSSDGDDNSVTSGETVMEAEDTHESGSTVQHANGSGKTYIHNSREQGGRVSTVAPHANTE